VLKTSSAASSLLICVYRQPCSHFLNLNVSMSIDLSVGVSMCLSVCLPVYLRVYLCDFLPCHQARVLIATVTLLSCVLVSEAMVGAGECPLIIGVASTEGRPDVFKSYIGGQWRTSSSGKTLKVMSPVNETTLFEVQVAVPVAPAPPVCFLPAFRRPGTIPCREDLAAS